jgi:hypothetical protein
LDAADLIERPLHRLGLHSAAWVLAAFAIAVVLVLAAVWMARRLTAPKKAS